VQLIRCPWCGPREEVEFGYGGQAHVRHAAGCRRWFHAVRDTRTYQFLATYPVGEPRPQVGA
jgi:sarcosine oxidase subunit delta